MGFKKPFLYLLALCFFFLSGQVIAATYDPRAVILLPKSGGNDGPRTLEDIKKQQEEAKKQKKSGRNNITVLPDQTPPAGGVRAPVILPNAPVGGQKELTKNEAALSSAYAAHLYTSICSQNYRDELAPRSEKNLDMNRMWADIQASCKCLSNQILAAVPAAELSDYVMFNHGWQPPSGTQDAEYLAYDESNRSEAVSQIISNQQIRKKCGFLN